MRKSELLVVFLVIIIVVTYCIISVVTPHIKVKKDCDAVVDSLTTINDSLNARVMQLSDEAFIYQKQIDSLRKVKNRVITEYISIYEEIDSAYASDLSDNFRSVFSKHLGE